MKTPTYGTEANATGKVTVLVIDRIPENSIYPLFDKGEQLRPAHMVTYPV
jgi:hypothetical protein